MCSLFYKFADHVNERHLSMSIVLHGIYQEPGYEILNTNFPILHLPPKFIIIHNSHPKPDQTLLDKSTTNFIRSLTFFIQFLLLMTVMHT